MLSNRMTDQEKDHASDAFDRSIERLHAERYPNGCRIAGHHCENCLRRLGQTPHRVVSFRRGARRGYRGQLILQCTVAGCPEARVQ